MFTTAAAQMNLRALLATLPDVDIPGADGDMAVMVKAVLAVAECPRLIAGCPDALIGDPLVTPGCSISIRWPCRSTCQQSPMMSTRRNLAVLER
jgi:hypothetical protein